MTLKQSVIKQRWRKQEKQSAKSNGGRNRPGSGNKWQAPGDVITGKTLISCKRTDGASIAVTDKHLKKHIEDAMMENKVPVWEFDIGGKSYIMFCKCDVQITPDGGMAVYL